MIVSSAYLTPLLFDIEGYVMSILGLGGREPFKTTEGKVHGSKHFGYGFPFVPIEKVM